MSREIEQYVDYPVEQHDVRVACGDPIALALMWILRYAENLSSQAGEEGSVTIHDLMEAADSHQNGGWEYISRGGAFEGESVDPTFWEKYAIVRGKNVDDITQECFFSCSC